MRLVTPFILALALSSGGCDLLTADDPVFVQKVFERLTCQGGSSADEAVSRLKSTAQLADLVVEAHEITAGPPGKVVTVIGGDEANPALQIILVFEAGVNEVPIHATKAGIPTSDDLEFVDIVVQGAQLRNCAAVSD